MPLFICLDGIDGTGKTTTARVLARQLNAMYYKSPGGMFAKARYMVDGDGIDPLTRYFYYRAATQYDSQAISRILAYSAVVCDRYIYSYKITYTKTMQIEYEATFTNVDKDEIRKRFRQAGAELIRPEYLQKRIPLHLPKEKRSRDAWLRVRDEGDKITLSLKVVDGDKIENQKELCLEINNFDDAVELLKAIGCEPKSYQETRRELWKLDGADITIDEWPFLEPFVEVEGDSEKAVQDASEKIGFNYADALFCAVGKLYQMKYGIHPDKINGLEKLVFDMENPFFTKDA